MTVFWSVFYVIVCFTSWALLFMGVDWIMTKVAKTKEPIKSCINCLSRDNSAMSPPCISCSRNLASEDIAFILRVSNKTTIKHISDNWEARSK